MSRFSILTVILSLIFGFSALAKHEEPKKKESHHHPPAKNEDDITNNIEARRSRISELARMFHNTHWDAISWPQATGNNKTEIIKAAVLADRNPEDVIQDVNDFLAEFASAPDITCGPHGRIDPEIAIEIVRTHYLSTEPIQEITNNYRQICGGQEPEVLQFLNDESCMELVKIAYIMKRSPFELFERVKRLYGWTGRFNGVNEQVATELVKAEILFKVHGQDVYDLYTATLDPWSTNSFNPYAPSPRQSVALVTAVLARGSSGRQSSTLADFKARIGMFASRKDFTAELIKIAAMAHDHADILSEDVDAARNWLGPNVFSRWKGTPLELDEALELVKVAYLEEDDERLLKLDHVIRGEHVNHGLCDDPRRSFHQRIERRDDEGTQLTPLKKIPKMQEEHAPETEKHDSDETVST